MTTTDVDALVSELRALSTSTTLAALHPTFTDAADELEAQHKAIEHLLSKQIQLFAAIKHGSAEHQARLLEAIVCHFAGQPVPPPEGGGRSA